MGNDINLDYASPECCCNCYRYLIERGCRLYILGRCTSSTGGISANLPCSEQANSNEKHERYYQGNLDTVTKVTRCGGGSGLVSRGDSLSFTNVRFHVFAHKYVHYV